MLINQTYDLDLIPGSQILTVHASQYDAKARRLKFRLLNDGVAYSPSTGAKAFIQGTKPDGFGFYYEATIDGSTVYIDITEQMTAVAGNVVCEIKIMSGSQIMASQNFILVVEKAALDAETAVSETDIPVLEDVLDQYQTIKDLSATATTLVSTANATASYEDGLLTFGIPRGGRSTITVGTTSASEPGGAASVTNTGTSEDAIFNFVIPRGIQGPKGDTGPMPDMTNYYTKTQIDNMLVDGDNRQYGS